MIFNMKRRFGLLLTILIISNFLISSFQALGSRWSGLVVRDPSKDNSLFGDGPMVPVNSFVFSRYTLFTRLSITNPTQSNKYQQDPCDYPRQNPADSAG